MLDAIAKSWWVLLVRGIAAVVFGVLAFFWPAITLAVLVLLFGLYALIDGAAAIGFGFASHGENRTWWEMIVVGLLGVAAGIITFVWPGITAVALLVTIGVWAIFRGILEIGAAFRLRRMIEHEWLLALAGVLSVVFGVLILARPLVGALAIIWLIAFWAVFFGVVSIALSVRLHGVKTRLERPSVPGQLAM